jgi:hypothetical protein
MSSSLDNIVALLCAFMIDFHACAAKSCPSECLRALMQLVATPQIVSTLLHLTLSPVLHPATSEGLGQAQYRVGGVQRVLFGFHIGISTALQGCSAPQQSLWWGLLAKMEGILALEQNLPYLEDLVCTPVPGVGAPHTRLALIHPYAPSTALMHPKCAPNACLIHPGRRLDAP